VRIERLELRHLRLPLVQPFETSFGRVDEKSFLLVTLSGDGEVGWGECVTDEDPYYSDETNETAWHIITGFVAPRVLGRSFAHPRDLFPALGAIRGHRMAKAAVEMAAWDLWARQQRQPLRAILGGDRTSVASGVSIGIQPSPEQLLERIECELAAGYQRIKIKIKPGWDVAVVDRVRERFGSIPLVVDANAAYSLADAAHLSALDRHGLMMIEQPLEYDNWMDHARLQERMTTPVCLDESITSVRIADEAIRGGACRVINVKPGRMGGHGESVRLHDLCAARGIPVWHGGMLESGIGRAHNLHLSTLPNFTLPGDVAASRRYFQPDLIEPPIEVRPGGTIAVPAGPGIGVTIVQDRVDRATTKRVVLDVASV